MKLQEQIQLLKPLFKGRDDVFALRWEKGNKSGYMPAYHYDPYMYRLHKQKGGTFSNYKDKIYLKLDDHKLSKHIKDEQFIGVYPLLKDNTSGFIVADFDKKDWKEQSVKAINVCKENGIPAYLERSRSGNGGHVWVFFEQPYPATKSRRIILKLFEQAGIFSVFDKNTSFDRLFPNQNYLSGKGFGNLIALPLQGTAFQYGNSCFIDLKTFLPIQKWQFLKAIKKVSTIHLDKVLQALSNQKEEARVLFKNSISSLGILHIIEQKFIRSGKLGNKEDIEEGSKTIGSFFGSEENLLENLLKNSDYVHHKQLLYLSNKHLYEKLKIRFVLNPFSFVFLLEGEQKLHIVLETLDTKEATYVWHLSKEHSFFKIELEYINRKLNWIRNNGRQSFLETKSENFSKIIHDYSEDKKGFYK